MIVFTCDFCGVNKGSGLNKGEPVDKLMIVANIKDLNAVAICDECVDLCAEIVAEKVIGKGGDDE